MQTKAGLATTPAGGRMTGPHPGAAREYKYEVTPLELFFDLAFVFGVSQLSHHLLTELSWRGAGQTLVMLVAISYGVVVHERAATMIRADRSSTRWMVLAVMLLGLFMNAAATRAFATSGGRLWYR